MSLDFSFRLLGMVLFALAGARVGKDIAASSGLPTDLAAFVFALLGMLFGLVLTPWITIRPIRALSRAINEKPPDVLALALAGLLVGLLVGLLLAFPLSLLPGALGNLLPPAVSIASGYIGLTIAALRARELWAFIGDLFRIGPTVNRVRRSAAGERELLLDTSVLIDGRIVDIAKTGFLGGTLVLPRFILNELHQVSDSSDPLRRNRGRRGLAKLNELQRDPAIALRIVEDDFENIGEVDSKLVMLAVQMEASIVTNDYNLNRVAEAQNVEVLNTNLLANAVRAAFIPGETFPIHVIQEGRDPDQGIGYLEDGTMVVVAGGKTYMDRTINVTVTRLINRETGRMIFAEPA